MDADPDDKISALPSLPDPESLERVSAIEGARARLRLPPMTVDEAPRAIASREIRRIPCQLVAGQMEPRSGSDRTYFCAATDLDPDADVLNAEAVECGVEFLRVVDALEQVEGNARLTVEYEDLIIEPAQNVLAGKRVPDCYVRKHVEPRRPNSGPASQAGFHPDEAESSRSTAISITPTSATGHAAVRSFTQTENWLPLPRGGACRRVLDLPDDTRPAAPWGGCLPGHNLAPLFYYVSHS